MAKEIKSETWGTVAATVAIEDDGDLLTPLKRLEDLYQAKGTQLAMTYGLWTPGAQHYLNAAEAVRRLQA